MRIFTFLLLTFAVPALSAFKPSGLADVTVTTAGTRQQITASQIYTPTVCVQAKSTNAGLIYVGGSNVDSTHGLSLAASQVACFSGDPTSPGFDQINTSDIYVDASANSQVAKIVYYSYR